jgi:single-strand DNA-binding protein
MGRLAAQPELRTTTNGVSVCSFTIACNRNFARNGEEAQTDWIDCVAWRQTAEFISKYFNKGSMIAIVGSLQTRTYEDKNGNKRKATEVVVNNAYFAESKKSSSDSAPVQDTAVSYSSATASDFAVADDESDLPF